MQDNTDSNEKELLNKESNETDTTVLNNSDDSANETQESRFKEGDIIRLIRVRFPGNAKSHPFLVGKRTFLYGQKVLAMSDRGMTVGYINSLPYEAPFSKDLMPLRSIAKLASEEDIEEQKSYAKKERDAEKICLRLIEKYNLEMNLTHVEFIQFGKKAVFYFTAPARVDFRDLVKELVSDLKMRIELRQISVRDRAAALGAVGACGLQTCCSSFLTNYGNVSIKMAKNQNLALIPSKINGVCGQIKCCIRYEDDVYSEKREHLPREGSFIRAGNGDKGKVLKLHILIEQFDMLTDGGQIRRYARGQYDENNCDPGLDWLFPTSFQHIVNETSNVIGITDEEALRLERYRNEVDEDEEEDSYDDGSDDEDDDETESAINEDDEAEIIASSKFKKEGYSDDDADVIEPMINEAPKRSQNSNQAGRDNRNNRGPNDRNRHQGNRNNNNRQGNSQQGNQNKPFKKNFKKPEQGASEGQGEAGQNRNRPPRKNYRKNRSGGQGGGGNNNSNKPQ